MWFHEPHAHHTIQAWVSSSHIFSTYGSNWILNFPAAHSLPGPDSWTLLLLAFLCEFPLSPSAFVPPFWFKKIKKCSHPFWQLGIFISWLYLVVLAVFGEGGIRWVWCGSLPDWWEVWTIQLISMDITFFKGKTEWIIYIYFIILYLLYLFSCVIKMESYIQKFPFLHYKASYKYAKRINKYARKFRLFGQ